MSRYINIFYIKNKILVLTIVSIFLLLVVAVCSYQLGIVTEKAKYSRFLSSFKNIREDSDKYSFISPLIGGVSSASTDVGIYSDVKEQIQQYVNEEKRKGDLLDASFYFRDLSTNFWFGDNEDSKFFPASLFKLPIAIAIYKASEDDHAHTLLDKQVVYTQELDNLNTANQTNAESSLIVGRAYSVRDLVYIMLTASDNGAKNLLLSVLDTKYLDQLFRVVAISDISSTKIYEVSTREYAHFLRILYSSSYLNEYHSEIILEILAKSTFRQGLVAGVPVSVPVAHKFGVYEFMEKNDSISRETIQLHDCGVIYHPSKPFIFCMMTKGLNENSLFEIISNVSKIIYNYQDTKDGDK